MTANAAPKTGVPASTMAALVLAVFTASIGFGVMLPLVPYLIERLLGASAEAVQVSRHTGLLTSVYPFALFLFAPAWGRLSDRVGRRGVLLAGLVGLGISTLAFSFVESLTAIYAERFVSGMFASALTPAAAAAVGELAASEKERARRLAFISMASVAGLLLGPMLSALITSTAASLFAIAKPAGSVAVPLAATALLALLAVLAVAFTLPGGRGGNRPRKAAPATVDKAGWVVPKLIALTFIVSAGIGVFDVGLALRGKGELGLTPFQVALMFTACGVVMLVIQAIVFSPWVKPVITRRLIAPALAVMAIGLFLVPWASDFVLMLLVIAAIAASAGILSPILTYWVSSRAGSAQGAALGRQAAATSLGIALGSAGGGLLFDFPALPNAPFFLTAGLAVLGFLLSLGLPHLLMRRDPHAAPPA